MRKQKRVRPDPVVTDRSVLELMLEAERRDLLAVACLASDDDTTFPDLDPWWDCNSVVAFVKRTIEIDEDWWGEIDVVDQMHYLGGPNYEPEYSHEA